MAGNNIKKPGAVAKFNQAMGFLFEAQIKVSCRGSTQGVLLTLNYFSEAVQAVMISTRLFHMDQQRGDPMDDHFLLPVFTVPV